MKKDNFFKKIKMVNQFYCPKMKQGKYLMKQKQYKFNKILLLIKMVKNKKFLLMIKEIHFIQVMMEILLKFLNKFKKNRIIKKFLLIKMENNIY